VDNEHTCASCGGVRLDRKSATARLSEYLKREGGASAEDADRRADEIVTLLGGGVSGRSSTGSTRSRWH